MNTLKTILYMGFMHGVFTLFIPYQLASRDPLALSVGIARFLAIPFWVLGLVAIVQCSVDMIQRGRGTPAHIDPPKELLIRGLYRYVRNPIYVGAMLVQVGFLFWFVSPLALVYAVLFFLAFHILVVGIEEPVLRNTFGDSYNEYCRTVPRWIPKLRAGESIP